MAPPYSADSWRWARMIAFSSSPAHVIQHGSWRGSGARAKVAAVCGRDARGARAVQQQAADRPLRELERRESLEQRAHGTAVQRAVALGAGGPHSRSLGAIEHPELDGRAIGGPPHDA